MTRVAALLASLVALLPTSLEAREAAPCAPACDGEACFARAARCLLRAAKPRAAKRLLKDQALFRHPASPTLRLLLARAYLELGNTVWALRTLHRAAASDPADCQVRAWLIWQHLTAAELDDAERLLAEPGCPPADPRDRGRFALLAATLQRYRKRPHRAAAPVRRALAQSLLFSEDRPLLESLARQTLPHRPTPLRLRADLAVGYSTNAMMSTPVDVGALGGGRDTDSSLMAFDLSASLEPPWIDWPVRPLVEGDLRSLLLLRRADDGAAPFDYSYLSLTIRPGVALGRHGPRLMYSGQVFLLAGDDEYQDGPRWFYETHRGELEWEPRPWLSVWGGAGRALFREQGRTRSEADLGVGLLTRPWRDLRVLVGLSGRRHWARHQRYDLWGGTLIGSLTKPLGRFTARGRLLASLDLYPSSAGQFADSGAAQEIGNRRDLLFKGALEIWSPAVGLLRFALGYEATARTSTAASYDFSDHRALVRIRIGLTADPWLPTGVNGGRRHVQLPYGIARQADALDDERIQELLRQEDAARRGSSCLN